MPLIWYLTVIRCSSAASTPNFTECLRVGWPTRMVANGVDESMSWLVNYLDLQIIDLMPGPRLCRGRQECPGDRVHASGAVGIIPGPRGTRGACRAAGT